MRIGQLRRLVEGTAGQCIVMPKDAMVLLLELAEAAVDYIDMEGYDSERDDTAPDRLRDAAAKMRDKR